MQAVVTAQEITARASMVVFSIEIPSKIAARFNACDSREIGTESWNIVGRSTHLPGHRFKLFNFLARNRDCGRLDPHKHRGCDTGTGSSDQTHPDIAKDLPLRKRVSRRCCGNWSNAARRGIGSP
jgi:hypothetical protein